MRIAIDVTPLLLRSAGVKNFVYYWLQHLRQLAGEESIVTFPVSAPIGQLNHETSVFSRPLTLAGLAWLHAANYSHPALLDWFGPRVDIFHVSHQLVNPPRRCRLTTTLYDMTCWLLPETHSPANVAAGKWFGQRVMGRADCIFAISESARADAIRILGLRPERVVVAYPGVASEFFQTTMEAVVAAREKFRLARPYVLFVGTVEPRKNLSRLLDAWTLLSPSTRAEFELAVAGAIGWADRASVERLVAGAAGVRFLGYVPEADLPGITAGAAVLAYPSLYEGFGFPVAQAMAAGVPVLTSNVSSLPEITRNAAVLVDPLSVDEIRAGLERLLTSPGLRAMLGANGREQATHYTWERCARTTLSHFKRLVG